MTRPARVLAFLILFIGGYNSSLPVAGDTIAIPAVFTPIQLVHGVYVKDVLLMLYVGLSTVAGTLGKIRLRQDEKRFALLIAALGFAGILSAVVNLTTLLDIGEALRLFLFAAYFCVVLQWANTLGAASVLRTYLLGTAIGGVINIYFTFQVQFMTIGILPFLLGQNGPGGYLGLAVILGAWLMLIHRSRADALVAVMVSVIGIFAATISYSRLAMIMAACGVVAWIAVIVAASARGQSQRRGLALLGLALTTAVLLTSTPLGRDYMESVRGFADNKFGVIDIDDANSVGTRYMYFWGVFDIFQRHPIAGVGYSGFYAAVTATPSYQTGSMAEEDAGMGAQGVSNPHNAFLYYISANGIFGLVLVLIIFVAFLRVSGQNLMMYGSSGFIVWACLAVAYFVNAMTLPTLYNTEVLYLPAAMAFSEVGRHLKRPALRPDRPSWSTAAA